MTDAPQMKRRSSGVNAIDRAKVVSARIERR